MGVVGVGTKDIEGAKAAMRKAISLAQTDTEVVALHIPKVVPEMMLSSMSDQGNAGEDTLAALANDPTKAGDGLQNQIKEVANEEMKRVGKDVKVAYKVAPPSSDVKTGLLAACRNEKADYLMLGAGVGGKGNIPAWAVTQAKGITVCVVREKVE